ncbi:hypothetical protein ANO14919_135820 [Xylariales sp. No.14919]|nr:hypothetical protein ANO14919_135820 [Xylariales sp. No.14919]
MSTVRGSASRISTELWLEILGHLVPSGAPTTTAIRPSKVELRPHALECRWALWAACLVSRQVGACARIHLYRAILINSCKELLYVYRTLRTVPELRTRVRSFSWTGLLPQSDEDDTECVDLMPSLVAVFASLPPPVTVEGAVIHQFLEADNLAAFRFWKLLAVVLAIIPKLATLFLALGRLMPAPIYHQYLIDTELRGGGTAEERARLLRLRQNAYEFVAIRALVDDPDLTPIGYPLLPELQVLILDHISNAPPLFQAFGSDDIIDDLKELCPRLRYIQTKGCVRPSNFEKPVRSTSMRNLLIRRQLYTLSSLPEIQAAYPNLTSLRIVASEYAEDNTFIYSFEALAKLQHLQYLSLTTPHNLTWTNSDPHLTLSDFLRGMESLQHLRVDFIWLAARNNPSRLFHIASLLPPSIQSLHLLDYWAISMTSTFRDRYPVLPDNKSAAEFMRTVLENLLQSFSSNGLTSLREVKLSSREYAKERSLWTGSRRLLKNLIWQFSQVGIRLTVTGLEEARDEEDGWWLNLD